MKTFIRIILLSLIATLALSSCSKRKYFAIQGEIQGLGLQTVTIVYYADGGLHQTSCAAEAGNFIVRGRSAEPTLCVLTTDDGIELATLVVSNGDKIEITGQLAQVEELQISGNPTSEKIAAWRAKNARELRFNNADKVNRSIAEFVRNNRKSPAATALLVTQFYTPGYETMADSLLSILDPSVRTTALQQNFGQILSTQLTRHLPGEVTTMQLYSRSDSVIGFNPAMHSLSLLAFRGESHQPSDSIGNTLRRITTDYPRQRLRVVEVSMARDSTRWKQSTARDSARWDQVWGPGTVASPQLYKLNVPRTPFFILADSTGMQIFRGSSVSALQRVITASLGHR